MDVPTAEKGENNGVQKGLAKTEPQGKKEVYNFYYTKRFYFIFYASDIWFLGIVKKHKNYFRFKTGKWDQNNTFIKSWKYQK